MVDYVVLKVVSLAAVAAAGVAGTTAAEVEALAERRPATKATVVVAAGDRRT